MSSGSQERAQNRRALPSEAQPNAERPQYQPEKLEPRECARVRYLRIIGWEEFQHYKNRRAPWIKAYTDLLDAVEHPTFTKLTDGAKLTLHHARLLAGVTGNSIPDSWITPGHFNMQTKPRVTELVDAGFLEWVDENTPCSLANAGQIADETDASAHAGTGARGRARSQNSPTSPSPLTEKQDEKPPRAGARDLVEKFEVTDRHRTWAAEKVPGVDIDAATEAWRDHFRHNGYKTRAGPIADADAAWRNWMRNEVKFSRGRYGNRDGGTQRDQRRAVTSAAVRGATTAGEIGREQADGERRFKPRDAAAVLAGIKSE